MAGDAISGVTLSTNDTTSTSGNYNAGTYNLTPSAATGTGGFNTTNYNISYGTDTGGLAVAQKALTVSTTGSNRTYDGTTTATVTLSDNRLSGDVFTDSYGAASFADKNAATGKTVSVSGIGISGTDAANYSFNSTASTTANIGPAPLTVTADNQNMTYGGTEPTLTYTYTGLVAGDTSTSFTGALAHLGSYAGTYSTVQNTLAAGGNYTIATYIPGLFTITGAAPVATDIPSTVVRVSQDPSLNAANNGGLNPPGTGSPMTSGPAVISENQPNTNNGILAPSVNTNSNIPEPSGNDNDSKAHDASDSACVSQRNCRRI